MRKHYIDYIRVIAIFLLVPYHTARIYDFFPFYIKGEENIALHLFSFSLHQWRMPILFLVSGVGTYFLLKSKNNNFIQDRLSRLLIPFLFAIIVIVPPQGYFAVLSKDILNIHSYWEYYPHFFNFNIATIHGFTGTLTPGHMWFILYLVIFSILSKACFSFLKKLNTNFINKSPINIYFLIFPLFIADALFLGMEMNPIYYYILFLYGFLLVKSANFERNIEKNRLPLLIIGIIAMGIILYLEWLRLLYEFKTPLLFLILIKSINTFSWVFAIIGFSKRYFNKENKSISFFNKVVFTMYILHQTIIVVIGYYFKSLSMNSFLQFFFISISTFILMGLIYFMLIRRSKILKLLLGAK